MFCMCYRIIKKIPNELFLANTNFYQIPIYAGFLFLAVIIFSPFAKAFNDCMYIYVIVIIPILKKSVIHDHQDSILKSLYLPNNRSLRLQYDDVIRNVMVRLNNTMDIRFEKYQRVFNYISTNFPNLVESSKCCVICHDDFLDTSSVVKLECNHIFHSTCIPEWLKASPKPTCPTCRQELHSSAHPILIFTDQYENDEDTV